MAGKTTHHCPLARKGHCIRASIPNSENQYCKTHQVYCTNPKGCTAQRAFIAKTDTCTTCGWMHPDNQEFEREKKAKNAQAVKEAHEKRMKMEQEKKTKEANALREKHAKELNAKRNKK